MGLLRHRVNICLTFTEAKDFYKVTVVFPNSSHMSVSIVLHSCQSFLSSNSFILTHFKAERHTSLCYQLSFFLMKAVQYFKMCLLAIFSFMNAYLSFHTHFIKPFNFLLLNYMDIFCFLNTSPALFLCAVDISSRKWFPFLYSKDSSLNTRHV